MRGVISLAIETDKYTMGMNILGIELLQQGAIKHSGIIAADFPGPGLIDSIIKLNGIHSNEKEILISQIASESSPLSGQQNRSSQNFKIDSLPVGTKELKWVIEPSERLSFYYFFQCND